MSSVVGSVAGFYPYHHYLRDVKMFTLDLTTLWLSYGGKFYHVQPENDQLPFLPIPVDPQFDGKQFQQLEALATLYVLRCPFPELPSFVFMAPFKFLTTVDIAHCTRLKMLPHSLCMQPAINSLKISRCPDLTVLPDNLGDMWQLTTLILDGNHYLQALPDSFLKLPRLEHLSLIYQHRLTALPEGTFLYYRLH